MKLDNSLAHLKRSLKTIPLAAQTFSKCHTQLSVGAVPLFLERAKNGHVWDIDGNEYVDQILSLAPIILGYQFEAVDDAVIAQLRKATTLSLPGILEAELAEKICDVVPSAEMVRYGKNGSDVTSGAVRAARAFTGRDLIACAGYHGWQDWYVGTTTRNKGVPKATQELTKTFSYNNIESLEKLFAEFPNKIAAVILEPIGVEFPKDNFLQKVKDITHKNGSVLIFDEMITGFRISLGGAQEYFKVTPDLTCFGKAIANGYPLAVVTGRADIMKEFENVFFSFTFGGELLSLAASLATLKVLESQPVIEYVNKIGLELQDYYNSSAVKHGLEKLTKAAGYGSHHVLSFVAPSGETDLVAKTVFQEVMAVNGVLTIGSNNTCYTHTADDVKKIKSAYDVAHATIAKGIAAGNLESLVRGTVLEPVFRKP